MQFDPYYSSLRYDIRAIILFKIENRSRSLSPHHARRRSFSNDTSNLLHTVSDNYQPRNNGSVDGRHTGTRDSYTTGKSWLLTTSES